jgi:hypothetical protein
VLRPRTTAPLQQWRDRYPTDVLDDMESPYGGFLRGKDRCSVVGLEAGDCHMRREPDSAYCYYHQKLQQGLATPTADIYPVWPLPENGYVLLTEPPRRLQVVA